MRQEMPGNFGQFGSRASIEGGGTVLPLFPRLQTCYGDADQLALSATCGLMNRSRIRSLFDHHAVGGTPTILKVGFLTPFEGAEF